MASSTGSDSISANTPVNSRSRSGSTSASVRSYGTVTIVASQSRNDSMFKIPTLDDVITAEDTPLLASANGTSQQVWAIALKEAWVLIRYAVPIICTMLLEYSFIVTSVVTIGHLSTEKLAGAALGEITAGVTGLSIIQGFACALDSLLPQAWTGEHPSHVGLWTQRMMILMTALLVPILAVWLNAEHIYLYLRQDPEVARLAALYLKYASFQLPCFAFNTVIRRYFQAQGLMHVPSLITIVVAPINVTLNYLLVWGPEPVRLEFIGAPIATSFSISLMSILYLTYGFFTPRKAWHPISSKSFSCLPKLFGMGLVGVGQSAAEWWSWELVSLAASQLGPTTLAAQSVLVVTSSTAYQVPAALGVASAVRIGNLLGAGNAREALVASRVATGLGLIQSLILAFVMLRCIFMSLHSRLAGLFNNDEAVAKLVSRIVPLLAAYQIVDGIAAVTAGILRACGKIATGALSNFIGYYILGIPLGIYLAFTHHLGLGGLWIGLATALAFVAVVLSIVMLRLDWDVQVQEAKERVEAGDGPAEEQIHA
ncbi:hypothetical protein FRC12_011840 [Ceratobasidium sp. 428]|nr:hypothetical protein FRC12_011840 [Ceratobasidium sp. 428]